MICGGIFVGDILSKTHEGLKWVHLPQFSVKNKRMYM